MARGLLLQPGMASSDPARPQLGRRAGSCCLTYSQSVSRTHIPKNKLCHAMMCAGAAAVRPQTEHFGCRAERDCKKQGELETKLHWLSWMQPPVHHHTGDRRALPALWDNRAQGLQRNGWFGMIESAEFLKPSGIRPAVPGAGGTADIAGVQCQGPREQETWAAHKQILFSSRVNAS